MEEKGRRLVQSHWKDSQQVYKMDRGKDGIACMNRAQRAESQENNR